MLVYSRDALPYKEKTIGRAALDAWRKKTRLHAAGSRDAEPPAFVEPAVSEILDSEEVDSDEQLLSNCDSRCQGGILDAWPEWSEVGDE